MANHRLPEALKHYKLPGLSPVTAELIALMNDPDISLGRLARVIERDPSLAIRVIALANSSFYSIPQGVKSVRSALIVLGVRMTRLAAIGFSIAKLYPVTKWNSARNACWKRILCNAIGSRWASTHFGIDADEAFLLGMLQDIGMLVFSDVYPAEYGIVVERFLTEDSWSICWLEIEAFAIDHASLGSALLTEWRMPQSIVDAVAIHHLPVLELDSNRHSTASNGNNVSGSALRQLMRTVESTTDFITYPTDTRFQEFDRFAVQVSTDALTMDEIVQKIETETVELAGLLGLNTDGEDGTWVFPSK